jgi:hypothetical protein
MNATEFTEALCKLADEWTAALNRLGLEFVETPPDIDPDIEAMRADHS